MEGDNFDTRSSEVLEISEHPLADKNDIKRYSRGSDLDHLETICDERIITRLKAVRIVGHTTWDSHVAIPTRLSESCRHALHINCGVEHHHRGDAIIRSLKVRDRMARYYNPLPRTSCLNVRRLPMKAAYGLASRIVRTRRGRGSFLHEYTSLHVCTPAGCCFII